MGFHEQGCGTCRGVAVGGGTRARYTLLIERHVRGRCAYRSLFSNGYKWICVRLSMMALRAAEAKKQPEVCPATVAVQQNLGHMNATPPVNSRWGPVQ